MPYTPDKSTWLNPNIEYLFNDEIIEYDIRDAGFSLIKEFKLVPPDEIQRLSNLEKGLPRHIAVGMMQRDDKELSAALSNKFTEVRSFFVNLNKLTDDRIISVKKDAIYTIDKCRRTRFGEVIFMEKNHYSSYIRFPANNNLEVYYSDGVIDIKGMSEHAIGRHQIYMIDFLRKIIPLIESHDTRARRVMKKFIHDYKSRELDEEYYIEFNNMSREINPLFNYQNVIIPITQIILKEIQ